MTATRRAHFDFRGVDYGAHAGDHATADQGRDLERNRVRHGDTRRAMHQLELGKRARANDLNWLAPEADPVCAAPARLAQTDRRLTLNAARTRAAERREANQDPIARLDVRDLGANALDDASRLVPEHHRTRTATPQAIDDVQLAVAHTRGEGPDQYLAASRLVDLDVVYFEGLSRGHQQRGLHARDSSAPPTAVMTTTIHGGTFQKASRAKAARPSAKSSGVRMAAVQPL